MVFSRNADHDLTLPSSVEHQRNLHFQETNITSINSLGVFYR